MSTTASLQRGAGLQQNARDGQVLNLLPFDGTRGSDNDPHEAAIANLDVFSKRKVAFTDYSSMLQKA